MGCLKSNYEQINIPTLLEMAVKNLGQVDEVEQVEFLS